MFIAEIVEMDGFIKMQAIKDTHEMPMLSHE